MAQVSHKFSPASRSRCPARLSPWRPLCTSGDDREIRDFLAGKTNGEGPLHKLYDDVLDEPVPERLLAVLRAAT